MSYTIEQNSAEGRFETTVEDHLCQLDYRLADEGVMSMNRVFVPSPVERRGIAGALTRFAMDYCSEHQLSVIPRCPYVAAWVKRHPEYQPLIHRSD